MESFAIIIVLFHPDGDSMLNVMKLIQANRTIVIIDNSTPPTSINCKNRKNLNVIRNNKNIGLAAALNMGIEIAGQRGFENIFLLDQDTHLPSDYFSDMMHFKRHADTKKNNYALYVPDFLDRNSRSFAKFPVLDKYRFRHFSCRATKILTENKAVIAITSGSLISLPKHQIIGPLPENYFIDFLDNEYCLRLSVKGFNVAVNCSLLLDHSIGHRTLHRVLGLTFKPNHHSPIRRYYISRNGIATAIRYFHHYKSYSILIFLRLAHEYLSIIFFENKKLEKLRHSFRGVIDGIFSRMGPYERRR